jgi:quercetin dioxygenase-like cupin family protein
MSRERRGAKGPPPFEQPQGVPSESRGTQASGEERGGPPRLNMNWCTIPAERVAEGIERQMVVGDKLMICRLTIQPRVVTAVHTHEHEQVTMVERGRVLYIIDGVELVCAAGDILHFPPHVPHGATMLEEEVVLVDVFTPRREDFLKP